MLTRLQWIVDVFYVIDEAIILLVSRFDKQQAKGPHSSFLIAARYNNICALPVELIGIICVQYALSSGEAIIFSVLMMPFIVIALYIKHVIKRNFTQYKYQLSQKQTPILKRTFTEVFLRLVLVVLLAVGTISVVYSLASFFAYFIFGDISGAELIAYAIFHALSTIPFVIMYFFVFVPLCLAAAHPKCNNVNLEFERV